MNALLRALLNLPHQASTVAYDVDGLHYVVILTTMAGAVLVTLVGGYFLVRYRQRNDDVEGAYPEAAARPHPLYKVVAIVALFALFLVWWVLGLRIYLRLRIAPVNSMRIYVTAKQWMWKFAYPEGARSIAELYVPAGQPVELIMTSRDVIHSFYVPTFRVKQDVVPGRYTTVWFAAKAPGRYPVYCTQYCGTAHSTMRAEVVALPPAEFQRWLAGGGISRGEIPGPVYVAPSLGIAGAAAPRALLDLERVGEAVAATKGCLRCHTVDGTPHLGPTWAGLWYAMVPLEGGGQVVADEAYLTESMMDPLAKIHRGYPPNMPSYLGNLSAEETAAILEFIRSVQDVAPKPPDAGVPLAEPRGSPPDADARGQGERSAPTATPAPGGMIPILDGGPTP